MSITDENEPVYKSSKVCFAIPATLVFETMLIA